MSIHQLEKEKCKPKVAGYIPEGSGGVEITLFSETKHQKREKEDCIMFSQVQTDSKTKLDSVTTRPSEE